MSIENLKGWITSNNQNWKTPAEIYNYFIEAGFFDPCPTNPQEDGLKIKWPLLNYVNPPYKHIAVWLAKSEEELKKGAFLNVFLIPARTDTKWFDKYIRGKHAYYFVKGRLKFNDHNPAPFPSMVVFMLKKLRK